MAFARKVNVTIFILIKTVIFIWRGGLCRDRHGQTGTDKDKQGQAWADRDRQGQVGTSRDRKGMPLFVPACPCLSCLDLLVPALSLLVPALFLALTGIIGK